MQLIRLNAGPSGRRSRGLFVVLLEDVAERPDERPLAPAPAELSDAFSDSAIAQFDARMANVSI
jgi:hypothetical protein